MLISLAVRILFTVIVSLSEQLRFLNPILTILGKLFPTSCVKFVERYLSTHTTIGDVEKELDNADGAPASILTVPSAQVLVIE